MDSLGMFLFGFVCGALGVIVWAVLATSSEQSRQEEIREERSKKNEFDVEL